MLLSTPIKIRTLQRKLYHKAKSSPDFRFYALYDKIYRADILNHAYKLVRQNKGAPGIDGKTFEAIEADEGKDQFLEQLAQELKTKRYRSDMVKRVWIPKADGSQRPLGIPAIKDRVTQMAVKLVLEPIFEADFCENSYGFRPQRSAHDAADAVAEGLLSMHCQVIDADLSKYFDTIPHAKLMSVVAERVVDGALLALIKQWLKAPIVDVDDNGKRRISGGKRNKRGTPQGGVLSPLLANLYLHLLDRIWERHRLEKRYNAKLVRYADDLVILCKNNVIPPLKLLRQVLTRLDLTLNNDKTRVVNAWQDRFDFLGFSFGMRKSRVSGKSYPHVEPSKRSVQRVKSRVKTLTGRNRTVLPLPVLVTQLNLMLRGWSGYFHYRNSSTVLCGVKCFTEERLRTHLRKRHKIRRREQGYKRFTNETLYQGIGLFKIPTSAGWK